MKEPLILLIETSGPICSVGISRGTVLLGLAEDRHGEHTRVLNELIRKVLEQSQSSLEDEGPGSFTSLRIGVVAAKGMAYALEKPLILVPGLKALATKAQEQFPEANYYLPLIDARRDEVYLAVYSKNLKEELIKPVAQILDNELNIRLNINGGNCVIVGSGAAKWANFISNWPVLMAEVAFSASNLLKLALTKWELEDFDSISDAKPFYLKEPNITIPKEKLISR